MANVNQMKIQGTVYDIEAAGTNITSGSATSGQVLIANGSGGANWGNKQDTLTAGTGISIVNNVISVSLTNANTQSF